MLFLPGPAIAEARGSIGGTVFSRNRHGAYTRNRSVPVNPNTSRQAAVRLRVEQLQQAWREELTNAERSAWDDYADGSPVPNRLGQQTKLTGINTYIRTNSLYMQAGGTRIDAAPPTNGVAALPNITYTGDTTDGLQATVVDPAMATDDAMLFFVSPPKPFSVNFFGQGFSITKFTLSTQTLPFELKPNTDVAIGQRYFIEARAVFADGRPSQRFMQRVDITS